jgi:hypothetical protein
MEAEGSCSCYKPRPSHRPSLDDTNNVCWRVQTEDPHRAIFSIIALFHLQCPLALFVDVYLPVFTAHLTTLSVAQISLCCVHPVPAVWPSFRMFHTHTKQQVKLQLAHCNLYVCRSHGRSVYWVGLHRSNAEIPGSNHAQGMDVCSRVSVLCCPV